LVVRLLLLLLLLLLQQQVSVISLRQNEPAAVSVHVSAIQEPLEQGLVLLLLKSQKKSQKKNQKKNQKKSPSDLFQQTLLQNHSRPAFADPFAAASSASLPPPPAYP
jgi:hypothetical protein